MLKRILAAGALGMVVVSGMSPADAATGLACQLTMTRNFTPSLGTVRGSATYSYTATGTQICAGISNGAPAVLSGTISVGNKFSTPSTNPACDALPATTTCAAPNTGPGTGCLDGSGNPISSCEEQTTGDGLLGCGRTDYWWQEPAGTLVGTAGSNTTTEARFIRWGNTPLGDITVTSLVSDDRGYLKLDGSTSGSNSAGVTVSRTGIGASAEGCARQPATYDIAATRDVGARVQGALWAVTPASNPGCASESGGCPSVTLHGADVAQST